MAPSTRKRPAQVTDGTLTALRQLSLQRRRRRTWAWVAGAALVVGGGAIWMLGPGRNGSRDVSAYTVKADNGSLPGVITASGELEAVRRVNVSPKRQGLLQSLLVNEGDAVVQGQLLARMDPGDFRDRLDELEALRRQAQADYDARQADYQRRQTLFDRGAISAAELDDYKARYLSSKAALSAANERIEQRGVEGSDLLIRAPFAGLVTERFAEPGAFVTPTTTASATAGATSSSIVELSEGLEVAAKVPESDIGRIALGQQAEIRVDAFPDERFQATVIEIAPRAEKRDNVTSFTVKLQLQDPPDRLRIGMTADINFQTGRSAPKTLVPTVAIVTENGKPGVLLVGEQQQPSFQEVELGSSSGDRTAILNGLPSGTRVFIDLPPWAKRERN